MEAHPIHFEDDMGVAAQLRHGLRDDRAERDTRERAFQCAGHAVAGLADAIARFGRHRDGQRKRDLQLPEQAAGLCIASTRETRGR